MPFCTIDPTETRAFLEDDRFDWLVAQHKPKSEVKAGAGAGNSQYKIHGEICELISAIVPGLVGFHAMSVPMQQVSG